MKVCPACGFKFKISEESCPSCLKAPVMKDGFLAYAPELADANEGFEPEFFEKLFSLELKSFWFNSRNKLIIWTIKEYFPNSKKFLEIGCGTGFVLSGIEKAFPNMALRGSEIYSAGLSYADKRVKRAELFQMDARKIPFEKEFDLIGAFDVLEHIEEDEAVLREMHRATKPGGGIIITVPQHRFLWSKVDEHARHVRRYSVSELKEKVERAGFRIKRTTSFVSILLPLFMASRVVSKYRHSEGNAGSDLTPPGPLNSALERLLDMERFFIKMGLSLPAGSSLLMAAEKA